MTSDFERIALVAEAIFRSQHPRAEWSAGRARNIWFEHARAALSVILPEGWQPIETWDTQPHGPANRVLICAGSVVGEAWFRDPEGANDSWESGWWWAGTGPGEYASSPVCDTNDPVTHWRHLPTAPISAATSGKEGGR